MDVKPFDLFISFARADRLQTIGRRRVDVVRVLKDALESHRVSGSDGTRRRFRTCTYDEDFEFRPTVAEAIESRLRSCTALLVYCSPAARESRHVTYELATFRDLRRPDVPRPILGAVLRERPEEVFPQYFGSDALGIDLTLSTEPSVPAWKKKVLKESHKVVAAVLGRRLEDVEDRFRRQERAVSASRMRLRSALVALLVVIAWLNSSSGFHLIRTLSVADDEPPGTNIIGDAGGDRFWGLHHRHLHLHAATSSTPLTTITLSAAASHACLVDESTVVVSMDRQLELIDLTTGLSVGGFRAPSFISGLGGSNGCVAATADGSLFVRIGNGSFEEAPQPIVLQGRHFPKEFQERSPLHWGDKVAWSTDCQWLAVAQLTGQVVVVDPRTWRFLDPVNTISYEMKDSRPVVGLAFLRDSKAVVFSDGSRLFVRLDLVTGQVDETPIPEVGGFNDMVFGRDETDILAIGDVVQWLEYRDGSIVFRRRLFADPTWNTSAAYLPGGRLFVIAGNKDRYYVFKKTLRVFGIDL